MPDRFMSLTDITLAVWTPVAVRVQTSSRYDAWDWHLSPHDVSAFFRAVQVGVLLKAQRRRTDGTWELVARRARSFPQGRN